MARVAVEGAHAEDGVRPALEQGRQQEREVGRVVLEVGVEDRGELALRVAERGEHGGALAGVALVVEDRDARRPLAPSSSSLVPSVEPSSTTISSALVGSGAASTSPMACSTVPTSL